jgi:predicted RNA-binding Zn-ribbon protein involved in translation (DUF1610 family)
MPARQPTDNAESFMKVNLDGHTLDIPCPSCGEKSEQTFGRLKDNPDFSCAQCGALIHIKPDELRAVAEGVQEKVDGLARMLSKLGK